LLWIGFDPRSDEMKIFAARLECIMPTVSFPSTDSGLLAWSLNFSTRISAAPVPLGLTAPQATAYATLHTNFSNALAACDPGERSKSLVSAKNIARTVLKTSARQLASIIQGQASVSDAQKIDLGLTVRHVPMPVPPPSHAPGITVLATVGNTVRLRLFDAVDSARRGKPLGVDGASVFSHVGANPPTSVDDWKFEGVTGKTKIDILFPDSVAPGSRVWFTAFWFNTRKENGPPATPISTNLPGGSAMAA
jgi:hypothetical protein